jgi:hypothetical protein
VSRLKGQLPPILISWLQCWVSLIMGSMIPLSTTY